MIRVGVLGHRGYGELPVLLRTLLRLAPELGLQLVFESPMRDVAGAGELMDESSELDVLITLGGDGTLLRGARFLNARPVPILGINLGRLGFLTACGADDVEMALRKFAAGDYRADARMALDIRASDHSGRQRQHWFALNDTVVHKGGFARVLRLRLSINDEFVGTYSADGFVVSTPTGSTAYSLSAGGPVVVPSLESIILTPIAAHTLAIRPLVLPANSVVSLQPDDGSEELLVTVDGQVGTKLLAGETVSVRRAPTPVLIVRFPGMTFLERLRVKLGWGGLAERD
jgi:NAD+ kinase